MSSSRRVQEDFRRIVGMPDTAGGLDPADERSKINSGRGIFLINNNDIISGDGDGNVDDDGNPIDPITPPEGDGNNNDDGTGDGDGNTNPDATDPDDFVEDPEDSNWDVGDDTYGGDWGSGGPINFVDCVDNTCIEIVPRGGFIDPEGFTGEWPKHWELTNITEEQLDNIDYIVPPAQGVIYVAKSTVSPRYYATFGAALSASFNPNHGRWSNDFPNNPSLFSFSQQFCSGIGAQCSVGRTSCANSTFLASGETVATCDPNYVPPEVPPPAWPEDGCIQLAPNIDGQWAASPNENPNDLTPKYSNPKSILDLCTPSGDGVQILPGADGGSVFWNYSQGTYMAISPDGRRSFGGSGGLKGKVAGSAQGGGNGPKPVGAPTPS